MKSQNFIESRKYAENRLERELPPELVYHSIEHTRKEVVPAVQLFAGLEGIRGETFELLVTAAWFHDVGYVEKSYLHELISARIAVEVLPSYGYGKKQVEIVRSAILATALPQSPSSLLEQILTDADLDVLGREEFMVRNLDLRREFAHLGREYTDIDWYNNQLRFMEGHTYFTESARSARNPQKELNYAAVKKILEELTAGD